MKKSLLFLILAGSLLSCKEDSKGVAKSPQVTNAPAVANGDTIILNNEVYASLAGGLSVREKPDANAAVIGKIEYGAPVGMPPVPSDPLETSENNSVPLTLAGMATYWVAVQVSGKTGYVVDAYISDYPPPPAGAKDLKDWANAMGKPYGAAFVSRPKVQTLYQDGIGVSRQLYTNGTVLSEADGHEYLCSSLQLPNTTVLKVLNCLRSLKDFEEIFKSDAPLQKGTYTVPDAALPEGYEWVTTYDPQGLVLESVCVSWSEGSFNTITITQLGTEVVVSYSSGV
jgi:hypothetical protein